jgi:hypothetical protein
MEEVGIWCVAWQQKRWEIPVGARRFAMQTLGTVGLTRTS